MFRKFTLGLMAAVFVVGAWTSAAPANDVDKVLARENKELGVESRPVAKVDDWAFLRRVYLDLAGRIPSGNEIRLFMKMPVEGRREKLIEKLLADSRFADRWTVFFADMLRLRSNVTGGAALTAYVHRALDQGTPYDELCRKLIATNGRANRTPEVGFVLGDNADPLALASVTSQVFLGVRIGCAQCHDHPFDVWTQEDFYGLAAFYGKTRRVESQLTRMVYTTEGPQTAVFWPPEDDADDRKPMKPKFPFEMIPNGQQPTFLARLERVIEARTKKTVKTAGGPSLDDLLDSAPQGGGKGGLDVVGEAKRDIRKIDLEGSLYRSSQLRSELADMVTSPRNRLFPRAIVNRLWKELIGRGFVEPVDDFRDDNPASHPKTMDYLAEEFVASGYDLRSLIRRIVTSDVYQRGHAPRGSSDLVREDLESSFHATPMRRMISEALYDSVVTAGHLFEVKHKAGQNIKVAYDTIRVPKPGSGKPASETPGEGGETPAGVAALETQGGEAMMAQRGTPGGYALEDAIELDFDALLKADEDGVSVERMRVMSREELEAQRMAMQARRTGPRMEYVTQRVERKYDDNPRFNSSYRIASPAPAGHFLRVFGQPARNDLGELREDSPTMRQALMMLNGRLTHEASRVGELEPIYGLLVGKNANVDRAIKMAYYEVLTRGPTADELKEANEIIQSGKSRLDGMADLRWVLLNCNEFRFLP